MKTLEYDNWKLQTPPENPNSDYSQCKCDACMKWVDINTLVKLGLKWNRLTAEALVCEECKKDIKEE